MKKLIFCALLFWSLALAAQVPLTSNLHFNVPLTDTQIGTWGPLVNGNFQKLDLLLACYGSASTPGTIVYFNGTAWKCFAGNTSGTQVLQESALGIPSWATVSGLGTITGVAGTSGGGLTGGGTSGAVTLGLLTSCSSGQVLAWNGSAWACSSGGSGTITGATTGFGLISVSGTATLAFTLSGTSGGVPYFDTGSHWASSGALTQFGVVLGGGAGGAPTSTAADTTTTHALFATATAPAFRAITVSDVTGVVGVTNGGTGLSAFAANQIPIATASNVFTAKTVPDCNGSSNALNYTQSTFTFSCLSITTLTNPMTTLGDMFYGGASGAVTRLAGPTAPAIPFVLCETPSGGLATAETFCIPGVSLRTVSGTSDTILGTDRATAIDYTSASAVAVVLPQAGTGSGTASDFSRNFAYNFRAGTGVVTVTPTTSTINGLSTLTVQNQDCFVYSDNTNYIANCFNNRGIRPLPTDTGAANAYVVAEAGMQTLTTGSMCAFVVGASHAVTGASTLNCSATGVKNLTKAGTSPLVNGDGPVGAVIYAIYDGTEWVDLTPVASTLTGLTAGADVVAITTTTVTGSPAHYYVSQMGGSDFCDGVNTAFLKNAAGVIVEGDVPGTTAGTYAHCTTTTAQAMMSNCKSGRLEINTPIMLFLDITYGTPAITIPTKCSGIRGMGRSDAVGAGTDGVTFAPCTSSGNGTNASTGANVAVSGCTAPAGTARAWAITSITQSGIYMTLNGTFSGTAPSGGEWVQLPCVGVSCPGTNANTADSGMFRVCQHDNTAGAQHASVQNDPAAACVNPSPTSIVVVNAAGTACASNCGTLYAGTPMIAYGQGGGSGFSFGQRVEDVSIDCGGLMGIIGIQNLWGEEGSGWGHLKISNCPFLGEDVHTTFSQNMGWIGPDEIYAGAGTNCNLGTTAVALGDSGIRGIIGLTATATVNPACTALAPCSVGTTCTGGNFGTLEPKVAFFIDNTKLKVQGKAHCEGFNVCWEIGQNSPATGIELDQASGAPIVWPGTTGIDISNNFGSTALTTFTSDVNFMSAEKNTGETNNFVNNISGDTSTETITGSYPWDQNGGSQANFGTSKQFTNRSGHNIEFTTVNGAIANTAATADASYTAGDLACVTATNTVGNCATTGANQSFIGILEAKDFVAGVATLPVYASAGTTSVNSVGSSTWTAGDYVCTDASNAHKSVDNGSTPCPNPQREVGIVKTTNTGTAHTVSLTFSSPANTAAGTVTSVATTAPLGGGTITTTGTLTCTTCVTSSSPGAGLAHFAGSTQAVTSSAVVNADITNATIDLTTKVTGILPIANGGTGVVALFATNPQTATYQVLAADFAACKTINVASGTFTITLVASGSQPTTGQCIRVINYGTGVVTIARSGQNINGATTSLTLPAAPDAQHPFMSWIVSDGTNYFAATAFPATTTTGTGTNVLATSPTLVTPAIGAATATSLLASGIVDGKAPITITTGTTATLGAATYQSGYTFNQEATAGTGVTYTLPATATGLQYCVKNSIVSGTGAADTGVLTVYPAASSYVILNGTRNTIGGGGTHGVASGGAAGDAACFVAIDATDWEVYPVKGTWTAN